jgi:ADP-ribosyl-[dinitrogen reductase] hydrolase
LLSSTGGQALLEPGLHFGGFQKFRTFNHRLSADGTLVPHLRKCFSLATSNFDTLQITERNIYKDILFGVAVGDALGVPVEFKSRQTIAQKPVTDMTGFGTYNLPAGTFSDDSSLAFCLAEALTQEFSLRNIGNNFVAWLNNNYWTPRGNIFDVGIATSQAIRRLQGGCNPELAGGMDVSDNGNGSLMRILPLLVYIKDKELADRYQITKQVSSITHGHIRSVIAWFIILNLHDK